MVSDEVFELVTALHSAYRHIDKLEKELAEIRLQRDAPAMRCMDVRFEITDEPPAMQRERERVELFMAA